MPSTAKRPASPPPPPGRAPAAPALFDAARDTGQGAELLALVQQGLARRRRRRSAARAGAVALLFLGLLAWAVPYIRETDTLSTPVASRRRLTLPDGSLAELNAGSLLRTDFRYGRRRVRLERGEAFFAVAKDRAHPFLVATPPGTVRVTGTQFNVRLADAGSADVTLFEGSVTATPAGPAFAPAQLHPGQQVTLGDAPAAVHTLSPSALAGIVAWRHGRIDLDGLTVAEVAARLAAYHGRVIAVDPRVAAIRLGGSFPLDDLPEFFAALKNVSGLQLIDRGDGTYLIAPR